ncbi:unnamed protein product [Withania somnifera]
MARYVYSMVFVVLAIMLFVAYDVQAQQICKTESNIFKGLCITKAPCRKACLKEKFTDGHCSKLQRRCLCTKPCVFENIPIGVEATLAKEANTLNEILLEEEIIME